MSVFSNPVGGAAGQADAYIKALLDVLGQQDPIAVQSGLLQALHSLTTGLSPEALLRPERPGKWSIVEVIAHLVDQELVNNYRLRAIVAEDEPIIQGYDQDRWNARLRYRETGLDDLLNELAVLRGRNLRLYRQLSEAELDRVGRHSERGRESARQLRALTGAHDLVHRKQIERIRAAMMSGGMSA